MNHRTSAKWCGGALLLLSVTQAQQFQPQEKPQPFWQSCEPQRDDAIQPVPRADENTAYYVCTDHNEKRWEVVDRFVSKECAESVPRERDTYQHFLCVEHYELMIRPEVRRAPTSPQVAVPKPEGGLPEPR